MYEYIEESNRNKYLMLVPLDKSKDTLKCMRNYGLKDLIRSVTNKSDNYDEKHVKIKFNSDDDLHLKKTVELYHTWLDVLFIKTTSTINKFSDKTVAI